MYVAVRDLGNVVELPRLSGLLIFEVPPLP